jgi:hypothetical protein
VRKILDAWLENYYKARPQINEPTKNFFGEYDMPANLRAAFEAMAKENENLSEKLAFAEMRISLDVEPDRNDLRDMRDTFGGSTDCT